MSKSVNDHFIKLKENLSIICSYYIVTTIRKQQSKKSVNGKCNWLRSYSTKVLVRDWECGKK